jgi:hypothetical protein
MSAFQGERGERISECQTFDLVRRIHQRIIIMILRHSGKGWTGELGGVAATSTLVCKYFTMFLH